MSAIVSRLWPLAALPLLGGCTALLGDYSVAPGDGTGVDASTAPEVDASETSDGSVAPLDGNSAPDANAAADVASDVVVFDGNCAGEFVPVVTPGPTAGFCPGKTVTLTSSLAQTYNWSSGAATRSIDVGMAASYQVTATDHFGCQGTSAAVTVAAYPAPAVPTIASSGVLCAGSSITLTSTAATSYLWSSGQTTRAITVTTAGTYTVTTTDANGCTAEASFVATLVTPTHAAQSFMYTGGTQTFTVPTCITSLTVDAAGAQGGVQTAVKVSTGGYGGRVQATLAATGGQVLTLYVGGEGHLCSTLNTGGYNGGGTAICGSGDDFSGTGGGASDIRVTPFGLANRILVAGGGGGNGYNYTSASDDGGSGGGLVGGQAVDANASSTEYPGFGGTQSAGGAGGIEQASGYGPPSAPGGLGFGGSGAGTGCAVGTLVGLAGGGGGGGYYGGGAGCWLGGGGGSSYVDATLGSAITHTQGYEPGNGYVKLTW
jgi:hypothetical protein